MLQNKINIVEHSILVRLMLWHVCVGKDPCLRQDKHKKNWNGKMKDNMVLHI